LQFAIRKVCLHSEFIGKLSQETQASLSSKMMSNVNNCSNTSVNFQGKCNAFSQQIAEVAITRQRGISKLHMNNFLK
jgi:hypothetical protein